MLLECRPSLLRTLGYLQALRELLRKHGAATEQDLEKELLRMGKEGNILHIKNLNLERERLHRLLGDDATARRVHNHLKERCSELQAPVEHAQCEVMSTEVEGLLGTTLGPQLVSDAMLRRVAKLHHSGKLSALNKAGAPHAQ